MNVVEKVISFFDSQTEMAQFCFVSRAAVTHWKNANQIPVWHVEALSRYTGLPKYVIRPDIFKKEEREVNGNSEPGVESLDQDRRAEGSGGGQPDRENEVSRDAG